ncbi:hypothetical protein HUK80_06135 [Flavobacterium sp. MAH-1]|uniref:Uncharacterized protein n=1 Tax=Flavobacterium agri TaxID=2743471 RepID=A0A7Y8Y0W6_9FLAO|nr:hypothetical protein [Flavobacterium agri]NUY80468.1 hypothetical protein [Flavobacterium agri]NYA70493.1 hypothetical protein [Flavobacterium agri]
MEKQIDFTDFLLSNIAFTKRGLIINDKYFFEGSLESFLGGLIKDDSGSRYFFEEANVKIIDSDVQPHP